MIEWFYAEGDRQHRGPLEDAQLRELYRSGRIGADTLVWRDGLASWQPLASQAAELGLEELAHASAAASPAVPPSLQPTATTAPAGAPPARGLSGCGLAAVVAAVVGVVLLALLGTMAAIAVPAYKQYVLRSQVAEALVELAPLKGRIVEFVDENGRCPVNDDAGFGPAGRLAGRRIGSVRVGRFDNGHCGLEARLDLPGKALHDAALWLDYDAARRRWECSSDADDRYLPASCRG